MIIRDKIKNVEVVIEFIHGDISHKKVDVYTFYKNHKSKKMETIFRGMEKKTLNSYIRTRLTNGQDIVGDYLDVSNNATMEDFLDKYNIIFEGKEWYEACEALKCHRNNINS